MGVFGGLVWVFFGGSLILRVRNGVGGGGRVWLNRGRVRNAMYRNGIESRSFGKGDRAIMRAAERRETDGVRKMAMVQMTERAEV